MLIVQIDTYYILSNDEMVIVLSPTNCDKLLNRWPPDGMNTDSSCDDSIYFI